MSKPKNENAGVIVDDAPTLQPETSTELAKPAAAFGSTAAMSFQDMDIPVFNVVQKVSNIDGETGSIVADKKYKLVEPEGETFAIVLDASKSWVEDIPYGEDQQPRSARTPEEAAKLARESSYEVIESAMLILLVPQPKGDENDDAYPYPIGDSNYALGRLYGRKGAFRSTYGRLATWKTFNPDKPLSAVLWKLKSQKEIKGKYTFFAPALAATTATPSLEVAAFLAKLGA